MRRSPVPLVLDADGLNAFTGDGVALQDRQADAVLTPHVGEFARLTGVKPRDLDADRPAHVRALAEQTGAVALLKGSRTVIAAAGGAAVRQRDRIAGPRDRRDRRRPHRDDRRTPRPGVPPPESAAAAAYLHGLAGVFAGRDLGEGALAGDVLERVPEALAQVEDA